ncbi:MAG: hypothetical protein AAGE52_38340 [Myxococcota bacterium]
MLRTHQSWVMRQGEIELRQSAVRHPAFILARTRSRGVPVLEIGGGLPTRDRRWLWVVLAGEAEVRGEPNGSPPRDRLLRAGEAFVAREGEARLLRTTPDVDLIQLLVEAEGGAHDHWRLDRSDRKRIDALAEGVIDPGARMKTLPLEPLMRAGVEPAVMHQQFQETPSPTSLAVCRAVTRLSCELAAHPGMDDIARELGQRERRASEAAGRYFRDYHASFSGWRAYLATLRVELAHPVLQRRKVRAGDLASWLGYRSTPALYHALQRRGLGAS